MAKNMSSLVIIDYKESFKGELIKNIFMMKIVTGVN